MSTILTPRDGNSSQLFVDGQRREIELFDTDKVSGEYSNVSGALETVGYGQLMGVIAATGQWTVCKSGASDGSQVPRGVSLSEYEDVAIAGTKPITVVNGGTIDKKLVLFDGSDDWDTLVGGIRIEDLLIANSKGLKLEVAEDDSRFDN